MDWYGLGAILRALAGVSGPGVAVRVMLFLGAIGILIKGIVAVWSLAAEFVRSIMQERKQLLDQNERAWSEIKTMASAAGAESKHLGEVLTKVSEREAEQIRALEKITENIEDHRREERERAKEFHQELKDYHMDILKLKRGNG